MKYFLAAMIAGLLGWLLLAPPAYPFQNYTLLEWTSNSVNENGFRIEKSTDDGKTWKLLTVAPKGVTSKLVPSATGIWTCFRVFPYNDLGAALPTNVKCVKPTWATK